MVNLRLYICPGFKSVFGFFVSDKHCIVFINTLKIVTIKIRSSGNSPKYWEGQACANSLEAAQNAVSDQDMNCLSAIEQLLRHSFT